MEPEEDINTSKRPTGSQLVVSLLAAPPVPVNEDIRSYFYVEDDESAESEPWTTKPSVPTPEEIMGVDILDDGEDSIQLAANIVVGPWRSKDAYLRTHYELLREDAVAPLRDAVAYIRDDPQMMDSGSVAIYEKVRLIFIFLSAQILTDPTRFTSLEPLSLRKDWVFESSFPPGELGRISCGITPKG
jgi:hypothetical protein